MSIPDRIRAYHGVLTEKEHHRYRSWEHCYRFFRSITPPGISAARDNAALQLGFYLARWGMYRGSSFLLNHTYTIHLRAIDCLSAPELRPLWERDFGSQENDCDFIPTLLDAVSAIRDAYEPFLPTDTLITKVLLGTLGCLPACDKYFLVGFRSEGFSYSDLNRPFIERLLDFCRSNMAALRNEQERIATADGIRYPLMKLVDMYFWQIGYEADASDAVSD